MELLRRSCDELGQTIIVVTHDPRAAAFSDRVVFLSDGLICHDVRLSPGENLGQRLAIIIDVMERLQT
jgi:putative ABC transport system ATP-binding protein